MSGHEQKNHGHHKQKISKFLQQRPSQQSLEDRNIIKQDPRMQAIMVRRDLLSSQFSNRLSVHDLFRQGVISGEGITSGPAKEFMASMTKNSLTQFFQHRPGIQDLVDNNVLEDTMTWSFVKQSGISPEKRNCHNSCMVNKTLYVFGGYGITDTYLSVQTFDTTNNQWGNILTGGVLPANRYSSTSACVDNKHIFIFGGFSHEGYWLNDLHVLDTNKMDQEAYFEDGSIASTNILSHMWYQPETSGTPPVPRAGHSSTVVGKKIYYFGGNDARNLYDCLYVLDTENFHWSRPHTKGNPPQGRSGHSAVLVNDKIVIFGGGGHGGTPLNDVHYLDLKTLTWIQPQIRGTPPFPRAGHTCCVVTAELNVLIFGGGYIDKVYNDVHMLNVEKGSWSRPADAGSVPCPRTGHSMDSLDGRIFVFGGCDRNGVMYNDLFILDATFFRIQFLINATAPLSPNIDGKPVTPVDLSDLFIESITEEQKHLFSTELDSTTSRVCDMLGKMEDKIKDKQSEMKLNQTKMIAYVKQYHKEYEEEFNDLRNEVGTLKNLVVTELADLKFQLLSFLRTPKDNALLSEELPDDPSLVRRLTQPAFPGAAPMRADTEDKKIEEDMYTTDHPKKKDENLVHHHQNFSEHQHPSHPNNSIIFDLNQLQNNHPLPLSTGMPGNSLIHPFVPPKDPTHYHQTATHIPESMIFAENFDEESYDSSSVSGESSSSLSVTASPIGSRSSSPKRELTPSQQYAALIAKDYKDGDPPQKKKRKRKRKKHRNRNKEHKKDKARSAPASPMMNTQQRI